MTTTSSFDQLAIALAGIDIPDLPTQEDLVLIGFETRAADDKLTFNACRGCTMKIISACTVEYGAEAHPNYVMKHRRAYGVRFSEFRLWNGRVTDRGAFQPGTIRRYCCQTCGGKFVADFLEERRRRRAGKFFCDTCGPKRGGLKFDGVEVPRKADNLAVVQQVDAALRATDFTKLVEETPDVVPQIMLVYAGDAPGVWTPGTPLECLAAERLADKGRHMVPFRLGSLVDAPVAAVRGLARSVAAGWVSARYFDRDDNATDKTKEREKNRVNPGFHQQFPGRRHSVVDDSEV